jgi:C4-dicarboxylate-specific signal transduction histidine kinase
VCTRATRLLEHESLKRRVRIELELDPRMRSVTGDAVQLQQVVLNLAFNALEAAATSAAERSVTVGTTIGEPEASGEVCVFIRDTGPGLAPDVRPHLFEPFFSTKTHGLGMGLAIVRLIVERHHGRIVADNDPAGGAVFRVQLPAARIESSNRSAPGYFTPSSDGLRRPSFRMP